LDNQNDTRVLAAEINWFIDILQKEMPLSENIRVYFEKNVKASWAKTQSILYYPFFSMGEVDLSLSIILKFIFLLIAGFMLLRLLRRKTSSILHKKTHLSFGAVTSITTLGYYFAVVMTFFIILSLVGVNLSNLTVIFGALGVGIGFGLQAITNNFISGIILLSEQVIKAGDIVKLENDLTGQVKKVAIRSTIIRTVNGDDVIVPNSEFISGRVNTWTYGDDWRRLTIPFGVAYGSDPDEIVRIAEESAREVKITQEDADHPVRVIFDGFGDSSLDFSIRVWCRMYQLQALSGLRSDYYFTLFRKIKEAGIEIPFPQRDLHVQSISAQVEKQIGRCLEKKEAEDEDS
jgi:small-conductance mechanosensitive channel|nr:mechanosensitive ion channel [Desulfobulbaceae bacterium]